MVVIKVGSATTALGFLATIFFFLGWVIFEGLKIEFFGGMVNPYIITGFGLLFVSMIIHFRQPIGKFFNSV